MHVWLRRSRVGVTEYFFSMGDQSLRQGLVMGISSANEMLFSLYVDHTVTSSQYSDDAGMWVHWAFVYNTAGNDMSIFRGGVAQALSSVSGNGGTSGGPTSATGLMYVGMFKWTASDRRNYNGDMDELRMYGGRALTQVQVASQMANPSTDEWGLLVSLSFDVGSDLGKDSSCRGVGDATTVTAVATTGRECGSVDSSGLDTCSR